MSHFITELSLFHYASEAKNLGIAQEDILHLSGIKSFSTRPSIISKVSIERAYPLLQILHDVGYQKNKELNTAANLYPASDIHSAYFGNARCVRDFLDKYMAMCRQHTSNINFEIKSSAGSSILHMDFINNKADFYVPQSFFFMIVLLMKRVFSLDASDLQNIEIGVKQSRMPDANNFSAFATECIYTKRERAYMKIPSYIMDIKNHHFNPFLCEFLDTKYNQHYGLEQTEDRLISQIASHLSAFWERGGESPNIGTIAEILGMSRSKLYRELSHRKQTFSSIVESQRKLYAIEQIESNNTSIAEISDRLGYANVSAFTRAFNRWFNVNPSKMRQ